MTRRLAFSTLFAIWTLVTPCVLGAQQPLRIAVLDHSLGFLQVDIANARGWLRDQTGFNTVLVPFKTGKDAATALFNREVDGAVLGIEHAIISRRQPTPVRQVVVLNRIPGWTLISSPSARPPISGVADLQGRKVGISAPGAATHVLLVQLLQRHGVKQEEVTFVRAGIATLPDILEQGGIDAGIALEPHGSEAVARGKARVILDLRDPEVVNREFGSAYPITSLLVRDDVITSRPQDVQKLVSALVWASKWIQNASADTVLSVLPREFVPDPEVWKRSFNGYRAVFSPDGAIDTSGIRTVINAQVTFGSLASPEAVDMKSLYTDQFWRQANTLPVPTPETAGTTGTTRRQSPAVNTGMLAAIIAAAAIIALLLVLRLRSRRAAIRP